MSLAVRPRAPLARDVPASQEHHAEIRSLAVAGADIDSDAGSSALPFSAVRVGEMLYLSGQLGTDSTGNLVSGGIAPETRQAMENIRAVLEGNGSSMKPRGEVPGHVGGHG